MIDEVRDLIADRKRYVLEIVFTPDEYSLLVSSVRKRVRRLSLSLQGNVSSQR